MKVNLDAQSLKGRTPKWYRWLITEAVINVILQGIQQVDALSYLSNDRRVKDWVFSDTTNHQWIGRIESKSTTGLTAVAAHWTNSDNTEPFHYTKCKGCFLAN